MNNKLSHERILICLALIAFACVIGYNAFFTPSVSVPTVIYTDKDNLPSDDEQYTPQAVPTMSYDDSDASESSSEESSDSGEESKSVLSPVNINTATIDELAANVPGVGSVVAQRIIDYRESNGGFRSIDEIMEVSGIGEKTFESMKDMIYVS